jgi:hypothetical protein
MATIATGKGAGEISEAGRRPSYESGVGVVWSESSGTSGLEEQDIGRAPSMSFGSDPFESEGEGNGILAGASNGHREMGGEL